MKLLDRALHELGDVKGLAVKLDPVGAKARHLEDLIRKPQQTAGALFNNVGEAPLILGEKLGDAPVQQIDSAVY